MTAMVFVLGVLVGEVFSAFRTRHRYRNAILLGLERARTAALETAEGCTQGDGTDAYEIGRHSGAMDVFDRISYLMTRTP